MDRSKEGVARSLARARLRVEPEVRHIFCLRAPDAVETRDQEPVKLLEIHPEDGN